ncbi:MAG: hypothetical protein ACRCSN_12925 [Dermatophilaceae bacterium]
MTPADRTMFAPPSTRPWIAVAAGLALMVAGCTGDAEPGGTSNRSGGSASTPSAAPSSAAPADRSGEVVGAAAPLTAVATTKGKASSTFAGATFTIYGLNRTDSSTLLTWRVTGGGDSNSNDANVRAWENWPVLVAGGREYSVITFDKGDTNSPWAALSNPVLRLDDGKEAPPQTALYPPLPAGTTEVTVRGVWFNDVKVPVTTGR